MQRLLQHQSFRFVLVGGAAAAVHFLVVLVLVQAFRMAPLLANVMAFLTAFQVSYAGHRFWTFEQTTLTHRESLPRFFAVASGSFLLNEALYCLLLDYTPLPYWVSLAIVLVGVAVLTFILGKCWAFVSHPEAG